MECLENPVVDRVSTRLQCSRPIVLIGWRIRHGPVRLQDLKPVSEMALCGLKVSSEQF